MTTTPMVVMATRESSRRDRTYPIASTISAAGDRVETTRGAPGGNPATNSAEIALDTPASRNTPPTPNQLTPMRTPASAGAITRIASCAVWLTTTATPICSGATSSAMKAIRAGR